MTDIWGVPSRPAVRNRASFRPSPIFLGIVAVFVGSGWALWSAATRVEWAAFGFVLSGWLLSLCLHEYAHAVAAYRGGDHSIATQGYLTLNPLKYTHSLYSIVLPLVFVLLGGIGLPGGAVYVNRSLLRGRVTESVVAAVGPLTNVVFALVTLIPVSLFWTDVAHQGFWFSLAFLGFLQVTASLLNLLPVPGLDGFGILEPWLPSRWLDVAAKISPYGFFILLGLFLLTPLGSLFIQAVYAILDVLGVRPVLPRVGHRLFMFWE